MPAPHAPRQGRIRRPDEAVEAFLADAGLATFSTVRPDGTVHVAPVRFTWDADAGLARVLTMVSTRKARNLVALPGGRAALCQVDGFRWVTLEGTATVSGDPERVAAGVKRYLERYRMPPPDRPGRVVVEILVDRLTSLNIGPDTVLSQL